jgi:hypothetical protein
MAKMRVKIDFAFYTTSYSQEKVILYYDVKEEKNSDLKIRIKDMLHDRVFKNKFSVSYNEFPFGRVMDWKKIEEEYLKKNIGEMRNKPELKNGFSIKVIECEEFEIRFGKSLYLVFEPIRYNTMKSSGPKIEDID